MSYYVQIQDPIIVRKAVLQSSKQLVIALQRYEELKRIRAKKVEKLSQLKENCLHLADAIEKLKKFLPEMKVDKPKQEKKKTVQSDISKLEDELKYIESRLSLIE